MANAKQTTEVRVPIQETFTLPSRGLPYNGAIPDQVTMRAMTTLDEKIRLSTNGLNSIVALINSCTIAPEEFEASNLKMFDIQYLLYMLRAITYGSDYPVSVYCDHCDKYVDVTINLDELAVTELDDDYTEPFDVGPLPVSKDMLQCKIVSIGEMIEIEKESKRILNKFKDYVGDPEFILSYKYMVYSINGNVLPDFKKQAYIENMNAKDLRYLDVVYDKKANGYGVNTVIETECPICGAPLVFNMPVNDEFFRPKFDF